MLLDLVRGSGARIAHIKVARLDRMNEVGVRGYDGLIRVLFRVYDRVCRRKSVPHSLAKLHGAAFGDNFSHDRLLGLPAARLPCDCVIDRPVLYMLGHTRAYIEVGCLVLDGRILLALSSTRVTRRLELLVLGLRIVRCRMLAEDKVRADGRINESPALLLSVEFAFLLNASTNLLPQVNVCHFFSFYISKPLSNSDTQKDRLHLLSIKIDSNFPKEGTWGLGFRV